jgi:NADH dehydrogenase FAD-containing subunit
MSAGQKPAVRSQRPGFPFELNDKGMVATDSTLRVPAHPRVFAIGDTAATERAAGAAATEGPFPATAQVRKASQCCSAAGRVPVGCLYRRQSLPHLAVVR